ncbi:MAG: hypothetical protein NTV86_22455 [Planctomycetota bacterium]|nr:hypothetical protein [Planctomycetota bacterium]
MCDGSAPKVTGNTFEDCPVGVQVWGFKPNDPRPQIGDNKAVRCEILVFDEQTEGTALWPLVYASPLLTRPVTLHVGAQGGRDVVTAYGQGSPSETCWFYSLAFAGNLFTVTAALVPALPGGGSTVVDRITGPDGKECRLITVNPGASILGREGCMDTRTAFVLLVAGAGKDAKILWRSPKIDRGSVTCSFADVDGDGVKEVVVCTGRWCEGKGQILIYHAVPAPSTGPAPSAGSGETTPGPGSSTRPGAAEARPVGAVRSGGAG